MRPKEGQFETFLFSDYFTSGFKAKPIIVEIMCCETACGSRFPVEPGLFLGHYLWILLWNSNYLQKVT